MCLLITQPQDAPTLSNDWLIDFHASNPDGVGVMYADNGSLIIEKILPLNAEAFIDFYHSHIAGKNCAFHLRMKTHGNIDLENCHPYEVLNRADHGIDLWLMHNGILSTGNATDTSKSDTWHYIRDYLRGILASNPDYAFSAGFAEIIGSHIGASNKFVLMDNNSRMAVVNQDSGVYWAGLWLSNTYAWTTSKSASKYPLKGTKKARKQARENVPICKPFVNSNYTYSSNSYSNNYQYAPHWAVENNEANDDFLYQLEGIFNELSDDGFIDAANLSMQSAIDFIEVFDEASFYDIAYMLIDGQLTEDWFIKVITDHKSAREAFPWLSRVSAECESYHD